MAPPQDFKSLQDGAQKSLVSAVKSVNRISAEDLSFQRTVNPDAAEHLDEKSARLLDISTRLLQSAARACGVKAPRLEDAEDVDVNWQGVVDVVDSVLEKADTALDEYTGLIKRREPPNGDSVSTCNLRPLVCFKTHHLLTNLLRVQSRKRQSRPARSFATQTSSSRRLFLKRRQTTFLLDRGSRFLPRSHMLVSR